MMARADWQGGGRRTEQLGNKYISDQTNTEMLRLMDLLTDMSTCFQLWIEINQQQNLPFCLCLQMKTKIWNSEENEIQFHNINMVRYSFQWGRGRWDILLWDIANNYYHVRLHNNNYWRLKVRPKSYLLLYISCFLPLHVLYVIVFSFGW